MRATNSTSQCNQPENFPNLILPKIHSLRRSDLYSGANEEDPIRRKSDDIVEEVAVNIDDLQNVAGSRAEHGRVLDDEELLLLRGPQEPPRGREGGAGGDATLAELGQGVDGLDDRGSFGWVVLGLETSVLVGDEVEEVLPGEPGLGGDGGAGDFSAAGGVEGNGAEGETRGHVNGQFGGG